MLQQNFRLYGSRSQLFSFLFRSKRRQERPYIKTNLCRKLLLRVVNGQRQENGTMGPCVSGSSNETPAATACLGVALNLNDFSETGSTTETSCKLILNRNNNVLRNCKAEYYLRCATNDTSMATEHKQRERYALFIILSCLRV